MIACKACDKVLNKRRLIAYIYSEPLTFIHLTCWEMWVTNELLVKGDLNWYPTKEAVRLWRSPHIQKGWKGVLDHMNSEIAKGYRNEKTNSDV